MPESRLPPPRPRLLHYLIPDTLTSTGGYRALCTTPPLVHHGTRNRLLVTCPHCLVLLQEVPDVP